MENRRTIIAIVLIAVIWFIFNSFITQKVNNKTEIVNTPANISEEKQLKNKIKEKTTTDLPQSNLLVKPLPAQEVYSFSSPLYKVSFSSSGAGIIEYEVNNYKDKNTQDSENVKIISLNDHVGTFLFYGSEHHGFTSNVYYNLISDVTNNYIDKVTNIVFVSEINNKYKILKKYTFYPDVYDFDLDITISNLDSKEISDVFSLSLVTPWSKEKNSDRYSFIGPVSYVDDKLHEDDPKDLLEEPVEYNSSSLWTSFTYKYFATIVKPTNKASTTLNIIYDSKTSNILNTIATERVVIESGKSANFKYQAYVGPRDYDLLSKSKFSFEKIINLGFFGLIAHPLLIALNFFYKYLGNYGFAIVLLTICIKAVFWPLTQKSYASMKDMQKLQPQMQKLRAKFGKDKQKLNQEMMSLYKENRVNPFGGCLPMLVQIPVFFALYKVLLDAIELRHAPFLFWITDLSAADTLFSDAMNLGFALGPLPLIMGFTMFLQQKMAPTNMDPMQAKIMLFMPVFFTFIFLSFPSGLVVYWLVNNILTIAQQYLINRK